MSDSEDSDGGGLDMFTEPEGYLAPEKPFTNHTIVLKSGAKLDLRLVGHNPLWGHLLWNAGRIITEYLEEHAERLVKGRLTLELGAGAGLPSLACASLGSAFSIVTDYPDADLVSNLQYNIDSNSAALAHTNTKPNIAARGYLWGADVGPLLQDLALDDASHGENAFDTLILADLLFNHVCHPALIQSILKTLKKTADARALVFFTPYRPWLLEKDLAFFEVIREQHAEELEIIELGTWMMDEVLFKEDRGDETLRRTVFGYEIKWRDTYLSL